MRKRKRVWLCLWILSLVGISFYGGAVSYGLFWGLSILPVVSFVYLLYVYLKFCIYQEIESRQLVCGQATPYYFVLQNEDKFGFAGIQVKMFPDYSFVEDMLEDVEYELLPGDEFVYRTKMICKYRGEYEIGVKEVVITDFFGIFRFRYDVPGAIRANVKPRLVELSGVSTISEIEANMERESYQVQNEPDVVVRDYVPGDSLKKIHWKAVARSGKLWVRKDTGNEKQGVLMLFDNCRYSSKMAEYLPLESKMLECVLALTLFFARKNIPVSVCYEESRLERIDVAGINGFDAYYTRISSMVFDESKNPFLVMEQVCAGRHLQDAQIVICVFHEWNDRLMHAADEIVSKGITVIAYVVTDSNIEEYERQNTARKKVIKVSVDADLEGVL